MPRKCAVHLTRACPPDNRSVEDAGEQQQPRTRRALLVTGLLFLVGVVIAGLLVARNLAFSWPAERGTKRATAEMARLRSDPGFNSAPAGAVISDRGEHDECLDPSFDARQPAVWRDYHYRGSEDDWFRYFANTLPRQGWTRADDFVSGGGRVLNFARHYDTFDAELIISRGEVQADITEPNFC
jgi:hypothetical protein